MAARADILAGKAYVSLYMKDQLTRQLQQARKNVAKFGADMVAAGTKAVSSAAAMAAPIAFATKAFTEFDDKMRGVKAVTNATAAELESMTEKARELGRTTSFSAVQVAELMTELGRAGFNPEQINRMTASVMNLSRATGTDAAQSAGIVAATLRQFALDAGNAARVSDVLTKAANSTFNTVEGLGESLKYAGPVAKELGMSFEDTVAILGSLGNVGIQGSDAGTALRRLGVISAASGKELKDLFGIVNTEADGSMKPLVKIMDEIGKSAEGMTQTEKVEKFSEAFGILGITAASVMTGTAAGTAQLADELRHAEGAAKTAADAMDSGLGGAFRIMGSALKDLQIELGKTFSGSIKTATQIVSRLVASTTEWISANRSAAMIVAAVAAGVGVAGAAMISFGVAAKVAAVGIGLLASVTGAVFTAVSAIGALMNPVGLAIVAVGAVAAKVAATVLDFSGAWEVARKALSEIIGVAQRVGSVLMKALTAGEYSIAFQAMIAGVKIALAVGLDAMSDLWSMFWSGVWNASKAFFDELLNLTQYVVKEIASALLNPLKGISIEDAKKKLNDLALDINVGFSADRMRDEAEKELARLEKLLEQKTAEAANQQGGIVEGQLIEEQAKTLVKADEGVASIKQQIAAIKAQQAKLKTEGADAKKDGQAFEFKRGGASAATFSGRSLVSMGLVSGRDKQVSAIQKVSSLLTKLMEKQEKQHGEMVKATKKTVLKHS